MTRTNMEKIIETQEQRTFWKKILGEDLYERLLRDYEQEFIRIDITAIEETQEFIRSWQEDSRRTSFEALQTLNEEIFAPFYQRVIQGYLNYIQVKWESFYGIQNAEQVVVKSLFHSIYHIPLRVCIYDMQLCKRNGELTGEDTSKEYDAYCRKLTDKAYVIKLCQEYPEMVRLLFTRMQFAYSNLQSFVQRLQEDKEQIQEQLCSGKAFEQIKEIKLDNSDSHRQGQKVIQCLLDNGIRLIYKPHKMAKEMQYQRLYHVFCEEQDLSVCPYRIIDRQSYGWAEYLPVKECESEKAVERYYKRMGIHLFLCYLLRITDMHQENILAVGEFPVVVDAETLPGIAKRQEQGKAEAYIKSDISTNVLTSGILPTPVWSNGQEGVIISALYSDKEVLSTVKLPVARKAKTSEMYIDYQYQKVNMGNSIPIYQGTRKYVKNYWKEMCEGFDKAYRLFLKERERIADVIEPVWKEKTRYLVRHTQQYSMYLSSSLHPLFLKDTELRLLMLQVLQKDSTDNELVKCEIAALMQLDIPLLECDTKEVLASYQQSAYTTYADKLQRLSEKDLQEQLELIRLSVEMMDFDEIQNQYYKLKIKTVENSRVGKCKIEKALNIIAERLIKKSVIWQKDIGWQTMQLEGKNLWHMEPLSSDFYHGIGGMALFVAAMYKSGYLENRTIYDMLIQKLCAYADSGKERRNQDGLMLGGGSVVYTFLLLYQMMGEERLLTYAKKQAVRLEAVYKQDEEYDLLSGNAGSIVVLTKLYELTKEEKYIELAVLIGDELIKHAQKQKTGCGFCGKNSREALSGMAHGNSGFLMAYAALLKYTKDNKYCRIIDELIAYENSLYDEAEGNWLDLRFQGQKAYANAWCHGAAGILLARLELLQLPEYQDNKVVQRDVEYAVNILFSQSLRKGLCICHGMAGNYLIMREYQKLYKLTEKQKQYMEQLQNEIVNSVCSDSLLPQDKYMMGFMTGISGIGYTLLQMMPDDK